MPRRYKGSPIKCGSPQAEQVWHCSVAGRAVRPRESHSPFGRHEAVIHNTSADRTQSCYLRRVRRCSRCFLDAVFVAPAHLVSVLVPVSGFGRLPSSGSHSTWRALTHHHPNPSTSLVAKCTCPRRATDLLLR
ncbi:uncharacterized protein M421DRAFT_314344 [Didymella exigua CBS 183.55]|uniref:Uncharacterized protein n=1 Tax=Didymella exigua CBS 183.55 TaxID=1150837 RepID=A0A6A5RVD1_9PLEO|nr:uncharacterized protein M421DRAFT_314344 [Didymella exigua CBS 183.55]KAF1931539.1 hypothetical protein M421DRAFT_314344 [Didymella exigua CBS 183.55]